MALAPAVIDQILEEMFQGSSCRKALEKFHVATRTFFDAIDSNPDLQVRYARAQEARAELLAEEIIEIADDERDPQKARNRIDARRWYASKMKPRKFGEKLDLHVTDEVDLAAAMAAARQRLRPPRDLANVQDAELVEPPKQIANSSTGSEPADQSDETPSKSDLERVMS